MQISSVHINAYIIGEHGDSSIPVWSCANVAGLRLRDAKPDVATPKDPEKYSDIHKDVVNAAYEIIRLKGYTNWAIGLSTSSMVDSICNDTGNIHAVSVCLKGLYGINDDIYLALPATIKVSQTRFCLMRNY